MLMKLVLLIHILTGHFVHLPVYGQYVAYFTRSSRTQLRVRTTFKAEPISDLECAFLCNSYDDCDSVLLDSKSQCTGLFTDCSLMASDLLTPAEGTDYYIIQAGDKLPSSNDINFCTNVDFLMFHNRERVFYSASSEHSRDSPAHRAFLNTTVDAEYRYAAWVPSGFDMNRYLQMNFNGTAIVTGIATQGRRDQYIDWVTRYELHYSQDANCTEWTLITDGFCTDFLGNNDSDTIKINERFHPVTATCVRIYPQQWNGAPGMRADAIGCFI